MDSSDPYSSCQVFLNLLSSQEDIHFLQSGRYESISPCIDLQSSDVPPFSSQGTDDPSLGAEERKERRKWSHAEDVVLISAWLNTSKDAVIGNDQKAGTFWKRISAYFNASPQVAGSPHREASNCKQRWRRLNDQICKFVGCYESALKEKTSGQNDNDVLKATHDIFLNDYKQNFTLEHVWKELRFDQKWCSATSSDGGRAKKRRMAEASAQSSTTAPVTDGEDLGRGRPPGVKASKAKAKKAASTSTGLSKEGVQLQELQSMLDIKEKLSKNRLLDSLIAKAEPLSEIEMALKNKLISDMLS